jgi:3-oxoacyl-[acyl-carrier-protein] synthase II
MTTTITGIGWVTTGGIGSGRSRIGFSAPAGRLPTITRQTAFPDPMPRFGRMDDLSRLGLSAMAMALADAGQIEWSEKRPISILAGTVFGCLHTDHAYFKTTKADFGQSPSPSLFAYTLPNCMLGEAAIVFGLTGPSYVVNDAALTDTVCVRTALENIQAGDVDQVLCGICDLGHPAFALFQREVTPGALFFMLEKNPDRPETVYGRLDLNDAGQVRFNGVETVSVIELAERCLDSVGGRVPTGDIP